jgi:hypothetical protein
MPETIKTDHSKKSLVVLALQIPSANMKTDTNTSPTSYTIATMLQKLFSRISRAA